MKTESMGRLSEKPVEVMKISNSRGTNEKKKRQGRLLFQILIVAGFLVVLWFSFDQNVLKPQNSAVPERWQMLELVSTVEGDEAMSGVNRLHGTEITLVSAYIANYAGGTERATAWVGSVGNAQTAAEILRMMVEGIAKGGAGFSNLRQMTIADHDVFRVDGPGGEHIFYISREQPDRIVWLTVNAADVLPILETGIKIF